MIKLLKLLQNGALLKRVLNCNGFSYIFKRFPFP